jgi:uncharacterized delta-60 repeat protein
MKFKTIGLVLLASILATASSVFTQNHIDSSFSAVPLQNPSAVTGKGQIVQTDDKVIIWGGALGSGGSADGQITRLNVDGSHDAGFSYCGCHLSGVSDVALQPDGKLLVGGGDANNKAKLIRFNTDGTLDASYNSPIFTSSPSGTSSATVWAVTPDGRSYVEWSEFLIGRFTKKLYRLNIDGSFDGAFTPLTVVNNAISGGIVDVVPTPDGKFYLGTQEGVGIGTTGLVFRYNADGTRDSSFERPVLTPSVGPTNFLTGIALQPDGSLILSGRFDNVNGVGKPNVARVFSAGNVDLGFTVSGIVAGDRAKVLADGKILIDASNGAGNPNKFYRLNADGSFDGSFTKASTISEVLNRWVLDSAGRVVFFGKASTAAQQFYRINPNGDLDAGFNPLVGEFGKVNAIARQADGKFVLSGIFNAMNGSTRNYIARINADGTTDLSFDPGSGFDVPPTALLVQPDGKILAIGPFTTYNGAPVGSMVRLNANGSLDTGFAPAFNNTVQAVALQPDGKIVAAGIFTVVFTSARSGLARVNADGSLDAGFNPIIGGGANLTSVAAQSDGKIAFSGSFSGVNGFNRTGMARLNADGTIDSTFNSNGAGGNILQQPDGKYILYGSGISRRNSDGSVDASFASVSLGGSDVKVNSVIIQAEGTLIVGGNFSSVNGITRKNLIRLNANGQFDQIFFADGPNGGGQVRALAGQPDNKAVAGGDFTTFQGGPRAGIVRITTEVFHNSTRFDFDGDGRADMGVFRPSDGNWYLTQSQAGFFAKNFGLNGDVITPGDFDGDGKTDRAIYRPSTGTWWYDSSANGLFYAVGFGFAGVPGDIPIAEDFDGDGKADFVIYRPSNGIWFRLGASAGYSPVIFGTAGDIPVLGDFDGDGKADPAIFRPSTGTWWYRGANGIDTPVQWGQNGDVPVAGDYDGDGKTDFAIFRPATGSWYILTSGGQFTLVNWGLNGDKPVPADYDGDGKTDIAIYRPSNGLWFIWQSTAGMTGMQFGLPTDKAVGNAFLP